MFGLTTINQLFGRKTPPVGATPAASATIDETTRLNLLKDWHEAQAPTLRARYERLNAEWQHGKASAEIVQFAYGKWLKAEMNVALLDSQLKQANKPVQQSLF